MPVDGDTYDIPAIIETAETRLRAHHFPPRVNGHREKFGITPENHKNFSAVTHVAKGKGIPPFLILYDAAAALTPDQAKRLEKALTSKGIAAKAYGAQNTNHGKINSDLGLPDDPSTAELLSFLMSILR